jgi:uncharacterized protein
MATIESLYRYPIKGLSPDRIERAELSIAMGLPGDRRFAIAHGATAADRAAPEWLPKSNFLQLARNERLARLKTTFDPASETLTIERDGKVVLRAQLGDVSGRMLVEEFFAAYLGQEARGAPKLLAGDDATFTDSADQLLSLIGLASVQDIARVAGAGIDKLRFRANVYLAETRAWEEFGWVGREARLGQARIRVIERIGRCAATNVNPTSGARDLNIPLTLERAFGHADCGVFAQVIAGGAVRQGDPLIVE